MKIKLILPIVIAVFLVGFLWLRPESTTPAPAKSQENNTPPSTPPSTLRVITPPENEDTEQLKAEAQKEQLQALPGSLKDVPRPVHLDIDENDALIINTKIKSLFDYYLSALGEEDIETIKLRVKDALSGLPYPARSRAENIFENYISYLEALDQMNARNSGTDDNIDVSQLILAKQEQLALRKQFFDPEVSEVFFGMDDAWDDYTIQKLKINSNELLTQQEKADAITALDAILPPEILEQKRRAEEINDYRSAARGLNDEEALRSFRTERFGTEAADRLESLDTQREAWNERVAQYREERDAALEFINSDSDAYQTKLEEIRLRLFSGTDLQRIRALDEIEKSR